MRYWRLEEENFDFKEEPSEKSRLYVEFATLTNSGQFRAARNNCAHLRDIFFKYINKDMGEGP